MNTGHETPAPEGINIDDDTAAQNAALPQADRDLQAYLFQQRENWSKSASFPLVPETRPQSAVLGGHLQCQYLSSLLLITKTDFDTDGSLQPNDFVGSRVDDDPAYEPNLSFHPLPLQRASAATHLESSSIDPSMLETRAQPLESSPDLGFRSPFDDFPSLVDEVSSDDLTPCLTPSQAATYAGYPGFHDDSFEEMEDGYIAQSSNAENAQDQLNTMLHHPSYSYDNSTGSYHGYQTGMHGQQAEAGEPRLTYHNPNTSSRRLGGGPGLTESNGAVEASHSPVGDDDGQISSPAAGSPSSQGTSGSMGRPLPMLPPGKTGVASKGARKKTVLQLQTPNKITKKSRTNAQHHGTKGTLRRIQSRINNGGTYGATLRGRPGAQARPPPGVDISIVEICAIDVSWLQKPEVMTRMVIIGATPKDLAKMELHATNSLNKTNLTKCINRLKKQSSVGTKLFCGVDIDTRWDRTLLNGRPYLDDLTSDGWTSRSAYDDRFDDGEVEDVPLASMIPPPGSNWPQGNDRLTLTRCLEYAAANPGEQLTTADWDYVMWKTQSPTAVHFDHSYDMQCLADFRARVPDPTS